MGLTSRYTADISGPDLAAMEKNLASRMAPTAKAGGRKAGFPRPSDPFRRQRRRPRPGQVTSDV